MKALSIRQPWAWAILHAGKRVENRTWQRAPRAMIGQVFLIHAAAGCTREEYSDASTAIEHAVSITEGLDAPRRVTIPSLKALARGALVGRARLVDVARTTEQGHRRDFGQSCRLCGADAVLPEDFARATPPCLKADPWAVPGALGLILADVEALPVPIPFKGALGFFDVPDALLR